MAFDQPETDAVYDGAMRPCLESLSIKAVRVDREEHNDDIDDKIMRELQGCAFAIADLTFARPSVYFEAGYAQRAVPVIYTCRRDHFRAKPNDEFGNFRVHFDLQMRNIISWKDPTDPSFQKRLSKRIRFVIAPILREQKQADKEAEDVRLFRSLPLLSQRQNIVEVLAAELGAAGYTALGASRADWSGVISLRNRILFANAFITENNSAKELRLKTYNSPNIFSEFIRKRTSKSPEKPSLSIVQDFFVCTTGRIPRARVSTAFPNFSYGHDEDWFFGDSSILLDWRQGSHRAGVRLHIVDGIQSLPALRSCLQVRLAAIKRVENLLGRNQNG